MFFVLFVTIGFIVKQVAGTPNAESKIASVEIIVDSERPISFLVNQINCGMYVPLTLSLSVVMIAKQ